MSTSKSKLRSKSVLIVAILTFGVISVILVASSIEQANAQQQQQYHQRMMRWSEEDIPNINGSVGLANKTSNFVNENVTLQFIGAAQNAQGRVINGTVLDGHLDTVQGYLVYKVFVANTANQTGHLTIMDPGNGEVLCTLEGPPLGHSINHQCTDTWAADMIMKEWLGRTLERAMVANITIMQFLDDGTPMSETRAEWEMPTPLDRVSGCRLEDQDEFNCELCSDKKAKIFQVIGNYCLRCWQQETHPDV